MTRSEVWGTFQNGIDATDASQAALVAAQDQIGDAADKSGEALPILDTVVEKTGEIIGRSNNYPAVIRGVASDLEGLSVRLTATVLSVREDNISLRGLYSKLIFVGGKTGAAGIHAENAVPMLSEAHEKADQAAEHYSEAVEGTHSTVEEMHTLAPTAHQHTEDIRESRAQLKQLNDDGHKLDEALRLLGDAYESASTQSSKAFLDHIGTAAHKLKEAYEALQQAEAALTGRSARIEGLQASSRGQHADTQDLHDNSVKLKKHLEDLSQSNRNVHSIAEIAQRTVS